MRICIVEDEIRIREGLIRLLRRIGGDNEIAGVARNGEEGVAQIERCRPDLVITDIRLPGMDGLEMLSVLDEHSIPFKAIVLSAYSEFSYAQRAIKLGVKEYLVKPIAPAELSRAVAAVKELIEQERRSSAENPRQLRSLENILYGVIFNGLRLDSDLRSFLLSTHSLDAAGSIVGVVVYLGAEEARRGLAAAIAMHLGHAALSYRLIPLPRAGESLLFLYNLADEERTKKYLRDAVVPALRRSATADAVMAWLPLKGMDALPEKISALRDCISWSITLGSEQMLDYNRVADIVPAPLAYPLELETRAKAAACGCRRADLRDCQDLLMRHLTSAAHSPEAVKEVAVRFVLAVFNALRETGGLSNRGSDLKDILENISNAATREELERSLRVIEELPAEGDPLKGVSLVVRRAEQMVREFYCQDVSLNELAGKLDLAPGYLGSLFRKEMGCTFNTFLKDCRIRKAKELLMGTDLKLYSIAAAVGFSDPKYFSRVFRESTGILPAGFRRLHR